MAKAKRSFRYQERSTEDVKERANARGGNFDSFILSKFKRYKVRDGKNLIRIMPPTWEKARHYGYDVWLNYGIGVDNQSYLSLSKMNNEKDPLLEARREAEREGDKKVAKALNPRQRILMWVIDRIAEDEGPQLWDAPQTVDKDIASLCFDEDTKEVIYIDDPERGCDLRFYKEGTGLNTKYPSAKMRILKPGPIHEDEDQQKDWLDYATENPVPTTLQFYDYEHIEGVFGGQVAVRDDDDDEDEKPRKSKRPSRDDDEDEKPRARRRADPEDEDDEKPRSSGHRRPVPENDDDDEPDEKPKRARSRLKEPEPDDDDEETEDPPPKKGGIRERLQQRRSGKGKADEDAEDDD